MRILGNPILGKIFRSSGLVLCDDGLHKGIRLENKQIHKIFLTNDVKIITELLELDFDLIDKTPIEDVLPIIQKSDFFNPEYFVLDFGEVSTSKDLTLMSDFLKYNPSLVSDRFIKRIRTTKLEEVLNTPLKEMFEDTRFILENYRTRYKNKFEQMKRDIIPNGYDPRNFQEDIAKFHNTFGEDLESETFFTKANQEEFTNRFLNA